MVNLTRHEKYVLIFLVFTALLGVGLRYYNKTPYQIPNISKQAKIVNINTATEKELTTLKGIGPKLAGRIVEHRRRYGYFAGKEDLTKVKGIGSAKLEDIKELISVE